MIYLHRRDKIVILTPGSTIERTGSKILIKLPEEDVEFLYEDDSQAILSFNNIMKKLDNYSSVYGIGV